MSRSLAVVTGANTGIGFEIARALSLRHRVVVGSRDASKGAAAAAAISASGGDAVFIGPLDVTVPASIASFAAAVAAAGAPVTLLVNNAGLAFKGDIFGHAEARATIDVNFSGLMQVTEALLPLLRGARAGGADARIVNVCSTAGRLGQVSASLQSRFADAAATDSSLSGLMDEFVAAVAANNYAANGWPRSMYGVSKLGAIAYSEVLARRLTPEGINVSACCPGYVSTAMSSFKGTKTPEEGADTPVWLATRAVSITGGFWRDRKLNAW